VFLSHEYLVLSHEDPATMLADVNTRYNSDPHRQSFAALFAADGTPIAGGLTARPAGLPNDGAPHEAAAERRGEHGTTRERMRAVAGRLPNGQELLVGRSEEDLAKLRALVLRALGLGLLPALAASLGIGLFASHRTIARVREVNQTIGSIMQGHLYERLPTAGTEDVLDQLADSVNVMLAEIERLLAEVKGVGDNIAHDLRTPLTRLRMRLESGLTRAASQSELNAVVGGAIADLDQSLAIITALLRIGELEADRRQAAFAPVALGALLAEAADLYAPLAEQRGIQLHLAAGADQTVLGDRGLLFEAVANLLDNAVKFAPQAGWVTLALLVEAGGPVIRVADTGAGIAPEEREAALKRFYRADPSRHIAGSGLGLSLVAAILRMHGFGLRMSDGAYGFAVDILCHGKGDA